MKKKENYNIGISIVKIILSFGPIIGHFWSKPEEVNFIHYILRILIQLVVPIFMFVAFLFTDIDELSNNKVKFIKRLRRLYIPLIFWGIVPYIFWEISYIFFDNDTLKSHFSILWQITMGSVSYLSPHMWFQFDLIVLTAFFVFLRNKIGSRYINICLMTIMFVAYYVEYTGFTYYLLKDVRYEIKWPIGRLVEMIPYAVAGMLVLKFNILDKLKKKRLLSLGIFSIAEMLMFIILWDKRLSIGFGNQGVILTIVAICMTFIFYLLPFECLPSVIRRSVVKFSKLTVGIYGMHFIVGMIFNQFLDRHYEFRRFVDLYSLKGCVIIYLICSLLAYILNKIPISFVKKSVT